jgi:hypothetical protein
MQFGVILSVMRRRTAIAGLLILFIVLLWSLGLVLRYVVPSTYCDDMGYHSFSVCPTGWRYRYNFWGCEVGLDCPGHPELSFPAQ